MRKNQFVVFKFITFILVMVLFFFMAYGMMYEAGFFWRLPPEIRVKGRVVICILYCAVLFLCLRFTEGINIGKRRMLDLIFGFFISALLVNLASVILCGLFIGAYRRLLGLGVLMVVLETLTGVVWIIACHRQYEKFQFRKEAVFIYGNREDAGEYVRMNECCKRLYEKIMGEV